MYKVLVWTIYWGLQYSGGVETKLLQAHSAAGFAGDLIDEKSRTGFVVSFNGC